MAMVIMMGITKEGNWLVYTGMRRSKKWRIGITMIIIGVAIGLTVGGGIQVHNEQKQVRNDTWKTKQRKIHVVYGGHMHNMHHIRKKEQYGPQKEDTTQTTNKEKHRIQWGIENNIRNLLDVTYLGDMIQRIAQRWWTHGRHDEMKGGGNNPTKGDRYWAPALNQWTIDVGTKVTQSVQKMSTIGKAELAYGTAQHVDWDNIQGGIAQLNMRGWNSDGGTGEIDRETLFAQLGKTRMLAVVLVDHHRTKALLPNMEREVETQWTGGGTGRSGKITWAHAPARYTSVGGVSIGLHPVIGRYAQAKPVADKWGRWVSQDIQGKEGVTTIIGTYGPTGSEMKQDEWD